MKCKQLSILVLFLIVFINYGLSKESNENCGKEYRAAFKNTKYDCQCSKDGCDYLTCCDIEQLYDSPKDVNEANLPLHIQKEVILTVLFSTLCAGTSLFFHWWNAYTVLFTILRRLQILDKKIVACQERMNKRAFSDALIGKLAHAANFDFTAAQKEADTLLNSMTKPPGADAGAGGGAPV